uniref:Protein BCCIP homolog n=1 Tax=Ciona savignyi TaxID=51511 RepID=H2Z7H2_CIOSA
MSSTKKSKEDSDDSISEGEEQMLVEDGGEVDIDFEGFSLSDHDYDGIRQLLTQLFSSSVEISLSSLSNALIGQNFIGTVLKQSVSSSDNVSDNAEDDVFALVSCLPLETQDEISQSMVKHFLSKCKKSVASPEMKKEFTKILESSTDNSGTTRVAFLINERFINVPAQVALPMFEKLFAEIDAAKKCEHKASFTFTHYVMVSKVCKDFAGQSSDSMYMNAEEEIFAEEAMTSFDYQIPSDDVIKTRRILLLTQDNFERSFSKLKSLLGQ